MHYLGIDWAVEKHNICLMAEDGRVLSEFSIPHEWTGFHRLHKLVENLDDVQVNIERTDGLLVDWLVQQGWEIWFTPPVVLAHRRPRRSKDDRGDAFLLAHLLRLKEPECRLMPRQSPIVTHLRQLCGAHSHAQAEQRRLVNRLIYLLQQYYPAALKALRVPESLTCLAFIEAYPTPAEARRLSLEDMEAFLRQQRYTHVKRVALMYTAFQAPAPTAMVPDGLVAAALSLIPLLRYLFHQIRALEKQMLAVFNTHPEAQWWRSLPGASGLLTPMRLLAWVGDDRSRFPTHSVLQSVAGTAPITRHSGKQHSVEFRRACSHPLRRTVDDMARQSIKSSGWARSYFNEQLARGHSKPRAYRGLANSWLRIVWKLWQTCEAYDETRHVMNRSLKGRKIVQG